MKVPAMKKLPSRFSHFVYGGIQSGLTSGVASGIASLNSIEGGLFLTRWASAWLISWVLMIPVVLLAAPLIRRLTLLVADDES
jgi:Protein of unknown function (DUF2798)